MMAARRFVLVRSVERWEARDGESPSSAEAPLDRLSAYAESPSDTTCLVLVASKLDGRRRIVTQAKKAGFIVTCDALDDHALAAFVEAEVAARGCTIAPGVARLMAQIAGPELGYVTDAVERVTLYAGPGAAVTEEAVSEVVVKVREASVFALVDAVGRRDRGKALAALADVYDPRDRGLPLLGLLAWSVRQLVKFEAATRAGARPEDAAKAAGAPPFKARDLAAQIQKLPAAELERWLLLLAEADLALKGSKRSPAAVLETLVLSMAAS
jgi:DNA polymerase-3 subunit delta